MSILSATNATPKKLTVHGDGFLLARKVVVVAPKSDAKMASDVVEILNSAGFSANSVRRAPFSKSKIIIEKKAEIKGVTGINALQIRVSSKKVIIEYTTEASRIKALKYLRELIVDQTIKGVDIVYWNSDEVVKVQQQGGFFDASSRILPMSEIETFARNSKSKAVYVRLVDSQNWRLQTDVFANINPQQTIYPSDGNYSYTQIEALCQGLERSRITIIPVIDLMSPNTPFERLTGHRLNSVEGMRFVRAIIEEYSRKSSFKTICLGTLPDDADERYIHFLEDTASRSGVKLMFW